MREKAGEVFLMDGGAREWRRDETRGVGVDLRMFDLFIYRGVRFVYAG
jgi:hypothetical protein